MTDAAFDARLPEELRAKSAQHFTPVAVARRAAQLLVDAPGAWVLDIGAGVGKLCIVAAASQPTATFVGVELRRPLVRIGTAIARTLEVGNVELVHGDALEVDWTKFDAFYLFNPFVEHLRRDTAAFDTSLELDPAYFPFYVRSVRARLEAARPGTRVVTYHGFGAEAPPGYVVAHTEPIGNDRLDLWIKIPA